MRPGDRKTWTLFCMFAAEFCDLCFFSCLSLSGFIWEVQTLSRPWDRRVKLGWTRGCLWPSQCPSQRLAEACLSWLLRKPSTEGEAGVTQGFWGAAVKMHQTLPEKPISQWIYHAGFERSVTKPSQMFPEALPQTQSGLQGKKDPANTEPLNVVT